MARRWHPAAEATLEGSLMGHPEFFSFGTNDLTQMTFGFSRDDIGGFVPDDLEKKLLPADPFQILDREGVGQLVEMAVQRGRAVRPKLKVGICGEPSSVEFCHIVGMDYVSCSPFRVPIARLAAAQAQLTSPRQKKQGTGVKGQGTGRAGAKTRTHPEAKPPAKRKPAPRGRVTPKPKARPQARAKATVKARKMARPEAKPSAKTRARTRSRR